MVSFHVAKIMPRLALVVGAAVALWACNLAKHGNKGRATQGILTEPTEGTATPGDLNGGDDADSKTSTSWSGAMLNKVYGAGEGLLGMLGYHEDPQSKGANVHGTVVAENESTVATDGTTKNEGPQGKAINESTVVTEKSIEKGTGNKANNVNKVKNENTLVTENGIEKGTGNNANSANNANEVKNESTVGTVGTVGTENSQNNENTENNEKPEGTLGGSGNGHGGPKPVTETADTGAVDQNGNTIGTHGKNNETIDKNVLPTKPDDTLHTEGDENDSDNQSQDEDDDKPNSVPRGVAPGLALSAAVLSMLGSAA